MFRFTPTCHDCGVNMFLRLKKMLAVCCLLAVSPAVRAQPSSEGEAPHQKQALLVGCTEYEQSDAIRRLYGPANDIPMFRNMLKERFGFQDAEIRTLLGWPTNEAERPTRENIVKALDELVATAQPGSQVVILISGHGTQVPVPEEKLAESGEQDDGLDEVFLPADARKWNGTELPNGITDNEFSNWFTSLTDKGVHLWVIFDTCHSGTMTRGGASDELEEERSRAVPPSQLGIPASTFKRTTGNLLASATPNLKQSASAHGGSFTGFSAAQAFEEAPELPRPAKAPRKPAHYYGLFTYSLVKSIERQKAPLNYRELGQQILNLYCAERGTRGPTPLFEGSLEREVLGQKTWGDHSTYPIKLQSGSFRIQGGELNGLTVGSVVALVPEAGGDEAAAPALYFRITEATPTEAVAQPSDAEGTVQDQSPALADNSRCRLHSQALGEMQVKLGIFRHPRIEFPQEGDLRIALETLPERSRNLFQLEPDLQSADWVLYLVPPSVIREEFDTDPGAPAVILATPALLRSSWAMTEEQKAAAGPQPESSAATSTHAKFATTWHKLPPAKDRAAFNTLANKLATDVQKIFTWQNVWRVAQTSSTLQSAPDLQFTIRVHRNGEEVINPPVLHSGETIHVQIENEGVRDYWVTLLFLGSDLSMTNFMSGSIKASSKSPPLSPTVDDSTVGLEGFVLLATPISTGKMEPQFDFLEQVGLKETEVATRGSKSVPTSPFGRLLDAARSEVKTRSLGTESVDQPNVIMRTWLTQPVGNTGSGSSTNP
ncbi:caspase family protein [Planctomicrobium sp. SH664]|uniref:caspase family protein n=1 Tax=Planctomicrobium sp. SH664 TaxID=3448125 RepID=UPI003F5CA925